jgi:hypothetical protein
LADFVFFFFFFFTLASVDMAAVGRLESGESEALSPAERQAGSQGVQHLANKRLSTKLSDPRNMKVLLLLYDDACLKDSDR